MTSYTPALVVCRASFTLDVIVTSKTSSSDDSVLNISLSVQRDDVIIFDHVFNRNLVAYCWMFVLGQFPTEGGLL